LEFQQLRWNRGFDLIVLKAFLCFKDFIFDFFKLKAKDWFYFLVRENKSKSFFCFFSLKEKKEKKGEEL